jgi:hypothetical protein
MTASSLPTIPAGAVLYQRATTNPIGVTAASSTNIGYLSTNISQLEVVGQLTSQDPTDMYNFTFQSSGPVTLNQINIDGTAPVRIQLLDGSGSRVIADSQGTTAQQQAFTQLTSSSGLNLTNGKYIVEVTYGAGGDKTQPQNYSFQLNSGTTFKNDYRTLASATTVENTLLAGGSLGYNTLSAAASLLTSESNGSNLNIFGAISIFSTNIFA